MLPIKEWYWDPKKEEQIQITNKTIQTTEVNHELGKINCNHCSYCSRRSHQTVCLKR
jgi:hypothetical protein